MGLIMFNILVLLFSVHSRPIASEGAEEPNLIFAGVQEGRQILTTQDDFVARLSPFDRAARLKTDRQVSENEYLQFVSQQVLEWEPAGKQKLQRLFPEIRNTLGKYPVMRFPANIWLILTTGREEGQALYTRHQAIILPQVYLKASDRYLRKMIYHELFHIFSRHNPHLHDALYGLLGYLPCNEIEYPDSLKARRITNPDAPIIHHYLKVHHQGRPLAITPILYALEDTYDVEKGGEFFRYLVTRIMGLEKQGEKMVPLMKEGEPLLLGIIDVQGFHDQVGRNTTYWFHPEEALAENFALHAVGRTDLPDPDIPARIETFLTDTRHLSKRPQTKTN